MNEPIINPWLIYVAEVSENLRVINIIIGVILSIITGLFILFSLVEEEDPFANYKKIVRPLILVSIITICLGIIIPSKDTIYTMIAFNQLTPSNIEGAKGDCKEIIDYVIEKVEEINNENK